MASGIQNSWSLTPATNATADSSINAAEGQAPSTVNDGIRALMAMVRKLYEDQRGALVTAGTATAYTLTTNEVLTLSTTGFSVAARMNLTNGANATLNVDGTGAKAIVLSTNGPFAAPAGKLVQGCVYEFVYVSVTDVWLVRSPPIVAKDIGDVFDTAAATAPAGSVLCYGQAISRTTYAGLFAVIGTAWGTGDGSTTFNVPDLRGRVVAGKDDMGGAAASRITNAVSGFDGTALGAAGGSQSKTLTRANLPNTAVAVTVTITDPGHKHLNSQFGGSGLQLGTAGGGANGGGDTTTAVTGITASGTFNLNGNVSQTDVVIMQPTMILNKCIFTGVF